MHCVTPARLGITWQMDVKHVTKVCYTGTDAEKFYQYTVQDEARRERFIYACKENSSYSTILLTFGRASPSFRQQNRYLKPESFRLFTVSQH